MRTSWVLKPAKQTARHSEEHARTHTHTRARAHTHTHTHTFTQTHTQQRLKTEAETKGKTDAGACRSSHVTNYGRTQTEG